MCYLPGSQGCRFPGSRASKSRDESCVGSCDMFPQSHDAKVTGLYVKATTGLDSMTCTKSELVAST